jgi:hypothetical protein
MLPATAFVVVATVSGQDTRLAAIVAVAVAAVFALLKKYRRDIDRAYVYNWFGVGCRTRMDTGLVNADGTQRPGYRALRRGLIHFSR